MEQAKVNHIRLLVEDEQSLYTPFDPGGPVRYFTRTLNVTVFHADAL